MNNHKALFSMYDKSIDRIRCFLCPQLCLIKKDDYGLCNTRKNINNELFAINYGLATSISLDPIEKKPLYHFFPGKKILSIGTFGCNMRCSFCQNYSISQSIANSEVITISEIENIMNQVNDNIGISFTYNEPFMWYEFIYDAITNLKAKNRNLKVVFVTNGYINKEPLLKILPYIDAMNIDLKAINNQFYSKICGAKLNPVLDTIKVASQSIHVEITTLIVTNENDTLVEIGEIAKFLSSIDRTIPLHLSRYFPNYKLKNPPTDIKRMYEAKKISEKYLDYVYLGNIPDDSNTYCHNCQELLIKRNGYVTDCYINCDTCPKCGEKVPIILTCH